MFLLGGICLEEEIEFLCLDKELLGQCGFSKFSSVHLDEFFEYTHDVLYISHILFECLLDSLIELKWLDLGKVGFSWVVLGS